MLDRLNNGRIVLSNLQAQKALNLSENTVKKAFLQLMEHGFLDVYNTENWLKGRAREWRLTFWYCGNTPPTHDWKDCKPKIQNEPSKIEEATSNNEVIATQYAQNSRSIGKESPLIYPTMSKLLKN